jgi:hypothetical protein
MSDLGARGRIKPGELSDVFSTPVRINDLNDLLRACNVSEEEYDVSNFIVNAWPMNLGEGVVEQYVQVKAWLEPKVTQLTRDVLADLIEDAKNHSPLYLDTEFVEPVKTGHLLELDLFDVHFGLLAWGREVDGPNYDTEIAITLYNQVVQELVSLAQGFEVERILLPLGQDLLNADQTIGGAGGATTKGTPQDVDTRWRKLYRAVRQTVVGVIDMLRWVAPVDVLIVPGNHAEQREFTLGDSLECWYRSDEAVMVDNGPTLRKYYQYGRSLIGLAHGCDGPINRLPMIMATERPEEWAATHWHEWHIGHRHRKKGTIPVPVEDLEGVFVRELPSIAPKGVWEYRHGYQSRRAAEAFLWHPENGPVGQFSVNLPRDA